MLGASVLGLVESLDASAAVVHLWVGRISPRSVPAWIHDEGLLDPRERDRARRLERVEDRAVFLASHTALRLVLSIYTGKAAHSLAFDAEGGQRPELAWPGGAPPVRFSLTHAEGLFAISVTRHAACGVDAERLSARPLDEGVLRVALSEPEIAHVCALARSEAITAFHRLWTRKEAVLKALGIGLQVDPRRVSVCAEDEITVNDPVIEPRLRTGWRVRTVWPTSDHVVSVAIRSLGEAPSLTLIELESSFDAARVRD